MTRYATIVVDPPWRYERAVKGGRVAWGEVESAPFPYPTLSVAEILEFPLATLAASDCALWLWTTNAYLPHAFGLLSGWGFAYRQTIVWGKNNPAPVGSIAPSAAEFLLFAKRGSPAMEWVWPSSVIVTPRPVQRTHSTKPECFLDYIEACSPAPRLELFARRNRFGWDTWGNDSLPLLDSYGLEFESSAGLSRRVKSSEIP